jgi:gamma-glutamyl-gamma-aminobutyraldehyde dehydrogenase/4-guanidinobutyraldehyde dehydrogenase/NAD-dependent aldehyde dehydrogenase
MEDSMSVAIDWRVLAERIDIRDQAFIGGKFVDAASGETFDCISPIDGVVLAKVASCGPEDVDRAVRAARSAFQSGVWADRPPKARKRTLVKFAELIEEHADELALLETLDMGKPIANARNADLRAVVECVRWYGEAIDKLYDEIAPTPKTALALITREPIGVVGAVTPWNFPLLMAAWKFAPALAAGNSVVLKPAEQSPLSALRVAELAAEAGIPEGVFNVVPGFGESAGQALGRHGDVDAITFTGSTVVGKLFLRYAGESNMKSVSLECGGKTPVLVFADAPDLDSAAAGAADGIFYNSGQVCDANSRLLVDERIHDALLEKIAAYAKSYAPGDPLDMKTKMGTIVDKVQTGRVLSYIDKGKSEGARLALGGNQVRSETGGFYIEPTIFDRVDNRMTIAREEIFGPVLSTIVFKDADEAVKIANDSAYGLEANLWTNDLSKAHRIARALRAGTVTINTRDGGGIEVPFGGYKQSGFGRDKSLHALSKYTQLKTTYIKVG